MRDFDDDGLSPRAPRANKGPTKASLRLILAQAVAATARLPVAGKAPEATTLAPDPENAPSEPAAAPQALPALPRPLPATIVDECEIMALWDIRQFDTAAIAQALGVPEFVAANVLALVLDDRYAERA